MGSSFPVVVLQLIRSGQSGGGDAVYLTGSFNNWQGKILMQRLNSSSSSSASSSSSSTSASSSSSPSKEWSLVIDIPPGPHQYKFIVDEEWYALIMMCTVLMLMLMRCDRRYNPDYPTVTNAQGVIN